MTTPIEREALSEPSEVERLRARVEVAEAGYHAAVSKAQWQSLTNHELNECQTELQALRAILAASSDEAIQRETARADAWVQWARDLARELGTADEDSNGSIQDARQIRDAALRSHLDGEKK